MATHVPPQTPLTAPAHQALVVRSLLSTSAEEREAILKDVEYNVFAFPAGLVTCDFLSDSGTSAMIDVQWAALFRADESYGRNWGYYCILETFRDVFERGDERRYAYRDILLGVADSNFYRSNLLAPEEGGFVNGGPNQLDRPNFFLVPQGRCAEHLLFSTLQDMISERASAVQRESPIVISNGFFDTTAANALSAGFELHTFLRPGLTDYFPDELVGKENPFKGDLDVPAMDAFLDKHADRVSLILLTITNNWAAAQPVSMANIRATAEVTTRRKIPLFFDACRFAENALFIHDFEPGYANKSIPEIVREMFSYVDGFTISLKKDGLSNMGGALCFRDRSLLPSKYEGIGLRMKERQILRYGNDSYGGMSGRDLMAAVPGLYEITKESYLRNRIDQVRNFAQKLRAHQISILSPPGGHAVFLDMNNFFYGCERQPSDFASVGFTLELLKDYGIRAAEAGPFGWEWDLKSPEEQDKIPNLVRFALPRHVFSEEHINYTVQAIQELYSRRHTIPNVEITRGKTMRLRHFSCGMTPIPVNPSYTKKGDYLSEGIRQLSLLSQAAGQDAGSRASLLEAFTLATMNWGAMPIPEDSSHGTGWISGVSDDHSPYEYSVALDQRTGAAELRFLIEAQPDDRCFAQLQEKAQQLTHLIAETYHTTVSVTRFELIRDLFTRTETQTFAMWHSYAAGKDGPEWKIYVNSRTMGQLDGWSIVSLAFARLEMKEAWEELERTLNPGDSIVYFSLDLNRSETARVKVYVSHAETLASAIAQKHVALCTDADAYEIQRFCEFMSGGSLGPYQGTKKPLSCFAFTSKGGTKAVGTIHFPVSAYAPNDEEIYQRVKQYMAAKGVSPLYRDRYQRVISAIQRRPLYQGVHLHAWVSLKQDKGKAQSNTFYLGAGLFG